MAHRARGVQRAGGDDYNGGGGSQASAERYDSSTKSWVSTVPMTQARSSHAAVLLASGEVLIAGGFGVQAAHEQGIMHRDLKSENLFLTQRGERALLEVLDFGIAKLRDQPSAAGPGRIIGTPEYVAPEQLRGASTSTIAPMSMPWASSRTS